MVIKYHISAYPALKEPMVARIYEAQSPDAVVWEHTIPERDINGTVSAGAGHQVPYTIAANGLDRVVHIVRLFTASGAMLHEYNEEPVTEVVNVFDPLRFKIGDGEPLTPLANTDEYINPLLGGLEADEFSVFRNQYGYLFPDVHYTLIDNGFRLMAGDAFGENEEFTIQRTPKVTAVVNDSVVGKWFGGFVDLPADASYDALMLRKLLRLSGNAVFTFPALAAIPIGYAFVFTHFGAPVGTSTIRFLNAPLIYNGATLTEIALPNLGHGAFVFDGTNWNVIFLDASVATQPKAGDILGQGMVHIGDVPPGDPQYEVRHDLNIAGDYIVQLSIRTNTPSGFFRNNLIGCTWWWNPGERQNVFNFSLQEIKGEAQDVSVCWIIIKL